MDQEKDNLEDEIDRAASKASASITEAKRILEKFDASKSAEIGQNARAFALIPKDFLTKDMRPLAEQANAHSARVDEALQSANGAVRRARHLWETHRPTDAVNQALGAARSLVSAAAKLLEGPYPSEELLPEIQEVSRKLERRAGFISEMLRATQTAVSEWSESAKGQISRLHTELSSASPRLRATAFSQASAMVEQPLRKTEASLNGILGIWQRLKGETEVAVQDWEKVASVARGREATFAALRSLRDAVASELADLEKTVATGIVRRVNALREVALDEAGMPTLGKPRRSVVEIFQVKPPPTWPTGGFQDSLQAQIWFAREFRALMSEPAPRQLLHLFHPFCQQGHQTVLGDDIEMAVRSAALVASAHQRAQNRGGVTVHVPSEGVRSLLSAAVAQGHWDVNLQQLVTGLGRPPTDLANLRAEYQVSSSSSSKGTAENGGTHIFLFATPRTVHDPSSGRRLVFAPWVTSRDAPLVLGVEISRSPTGLSSQLAGRVFLTKDVDVQHPTSVEIRVTHPSAERPINGSPEEMIGAVLKIPADAPLDSDERVDRASPALLSLVGAVKDGERAASGLPLIQAVYLGCDLPSVGEAALKEVQRALAERFGYRPVGEAGGDQEATSALCDSLEEWERVVLPESSVKIVIFTRIQDPALSVALRGRVCMLHQFLPIFNPAEKTRVNRQFAPQATVIYKWPKEFTDQLAKAFPLSSPKFEDLNRRIRQVAINA